MQYLPNWKKPHIIPVCAFEKNSRDIKYLGFFEIFCWKIRDAHVEKLQRQARKRFCILPWTLDSGRRVDLRCIEVWQKTDNIDFIRFSFFVQEADLGLDDLTVTSQRSQVVDFSAPYETSTLEVMLQVCSTHYAPTIFYTLSKEKVWKWSSLN